MADERFKPYDIGPEGVLEDIQPGLEVFFVPFSDGYLIAKDIDNIPPDIVYFVNVYDIGPMNFQEGLADEFFFHVFQGAVGNIAFWRRHEFNVIAHAFEEKDIVLSDFDQFVFGFDEQEILVGQWRDRGRESGRWLGRGGFCGL